MNMENSSFVNHIYNLLFLTSHSLGPYLWNGMGYSHQIVNEYGKSVNKKESHEKIFPELSACMVIIRIMCLLLLGV